MCQDNGITEVFTLDEWNSEEAILKQIDKSDL